jgi:hypothetical protein
MEHLKTEILINDMAPIDVVIFQEQNQWVAQTLFFDLAAQSDSLEDIIYQMERTIVGHILACKEMNQLPFISLPITPAKFIKIWKQARWIEPRVSTWSIP